jgi:hypothetical protein
MEPHEAEVAASIFKEIVNSLAYYNSAAKSAEIAKYSADNLQEYCSGDPDSVLLARNDGVVVGICISRLSTTQRYVHVAKDHLLATLRIRHPNHHLKIKTTHMIPASNC